MSDPDGANTTRTRIAVACAVLVLAASGAALALVLWSRELRERGTPHGNGSIPSFEEYMRRLADAGMPQGFELLEALHRRQLEWSHTVYGGAEAAAAAGFVMPAPEKLPRFVDIRTWQAYLEQLKGLVQSADIETVGSRSSRRLEDLAGDMRSFLPLTMAVKANVVHRLRFEKLSSLDALAGLAEMRDSRGNDLVSGHVDDAHLAVQRRAVAAAGLSEHQVAALVKGRRVVRDKFSRIAEERKHLVTHLHKYAAGEQPCREQGAAHARQLQSNMQQEMSVLNDFHTYFYCEVLSVLQYARVTVTAAPNLPDPLVIGDLLAAMQRQKTGPAERGLPPSSHTSQA